MKFDFVFLTSILTFWPRRSKVKMKICLEWLKWSFTYKQHARGPPQNHSWKFDLTPFQTGILKINAGFAEKMPKKVEIITRTTANYVLVISVWGFWPKSPIFWPNFKNNYLTKNVVLNLIFLFCKFFLLN